MKVRLPGLHAELEARFWTIADLVRASGLTWSTVYNAERGEAVSPATAKKIEAALEASPPSSTALRLLNDGSARAFGEPNGL